MTASCMVNRVYQQAATASSSGYFDDMLLPVCLEDTFGKRSLLTYQRYLVTLCLHNRKSAARYNPVGRLTLNIIL